MVVLEAEVGDVDLDFFAHGLEVVANAAEFLPYFEEALFYLLLNRWIQLLLSILYLQLLPRELLQRLINPGARLRLPTAQVVLLNRLLLGLIRATMRSHCLREIILDLR